MAIGLASCSDISSPLPDRLSFGEELRDGRIADRLVRAVELPNRVINRLRSIECPRGFPSFKRAPSDATGASHHQLQNWISAAAEYFKNLPKCHICLSKGNI